MQHDIPRPEVWAGIECTINRIKNGYIDQLELSGHYSREDDIDAIAGLGIKSLRYPILWEKHQPDKNIQPDFSWASSRLNRIKELGINPIIGLIHHGSGPAYTNLMDPKFPELLAAYAKEVATEFPWITMYTPINEPLTTARFSGLYGLWYPHKKNDACFARMLINQLKGIVLSMHEIRKINPNAILVQTEDLGKTYSTPLLRYQARTENRRRFLTYDILCGQFNQKHRLWNYFMRLGITAEEMDFFIENPCAPDIMGVNYYVTSERFIDEKMSKYPKHTRGGNTIHNYADVEAIRVKIKQPHGFKVLMRELWKRYHIPIAVTEAHLHCSREEQMKWFREIYEYASQLKNSGLDIRAVTVWSVLGAYGWNTLLTTQNGEYERGTFDVSSGSRRPTAMAPMIKALAESGTYHNPILNNKGWWKCETRYFSNKTLPEIKQNGRSSRPILILGKTGTLGRAFSRLCHLRSLNHVLLGRKDADILRTEDIERVIQKYNPWAIINATGYVRVDDAENDAENCHRENTTGPEKLAMACGDFNVKLMTFSSDLVFDGEKNSPYIESDAVNPLNVYGQSKAHAESRVGDILPESLIIRTSAFFGPWDEHNFVYHLLQALENGNQFHASNEQVISPTYVPHLVNASLDLLIDGESGIWHLSNNQAISWYEFAVMAARKAGYRSENIIAATPDLPARRPKFSALQSEKGVLMPTLKKAVDEYFTEALIFA